MSVLVALQTADGAVLAGTITGQSGVSGALTTAIRLEGTVAAQSALSGGLTTGIPLAGTVAGQSAATGALTTAIQLAGTVADQSALTADLTTAIRLTGTVAGQSALSGALTTGILLAGAVAGQSALSGDLTTAIRLVGQVDGVSVFLPADLATGAGAGAALEGAIEAIAIVAGALTAPGALASGRGGGMIRRSPVLRRSPVPQILAPIALSGTIHGTSRVRGDLSTAPGPINDDEELLAILLDLALVAA